MTLHVTTPASIKRDAELAELYLAMHWLRTCIRNAEGERNYAEVVRLTVERSAVVAKLQTYFPNQTAEQILNTCYGN